MYICIFAEKCLKEYVRITCRGFFFSFSFPYTLTFYHEDVLCLKAVHLSDLKRFFQSFPPCYSQIKL